MTAKPCPFCGYGGLKFGTNQGSKYGFAFCAKCCAQGPEVRTEYAPMEDWMDDAIEEWNKRA